MRYIGNKEKILNIKWIWDYETGNNEEEILNNDIPYYLGDIVKNNR